MKKLITKYWGLVLVVVLLSSLFVAATPVAAGNYMLSNSAALPTGLFGDTTLAPAAGLDIYDAAQSGNTIYITGENAAAADYLYKSVDGGATWTLLTPLFLAAGTWGIVAVAPDDPNVVVVVDTATAPDTVYLSTSGGAVFSALTAFGVATTVINDVAISPTNGFARYLTVGGRTLAVAAAGSAYVATWTIGAVAPAWTVPVGFNAAGPVPTGATAVASLDDVEDVEFSPNFLADQALLIITETIGTAGLVGECALHVYSFNTLNWDAAIDVTFPRVIEYTAGVAGVLTVTRAQMALDSNFFLADEAAQIGFIGADITAPAATVAGGVYRVGTYAVVAGDSILTQITNGTIRDVAWDGTNLIASQNAAGGIIYRSSTALSVVPAFLQNSTLKAPTSATGVVNSILFNGTSAYAFCAIANEGIAKSMDLGKSWNGVKLLEAGSFALVTDFWVSPDGSVKYFTTDNGVTSQVWRSNGPVTQRIMILAVTGQVILVRADAENPANVYIAYRGAANMYKSTDSGDTIWTARSAPTTVADLAVQDANTVYVGSSAAGLVYKSTNGAFTWLPPASANFLTGGGVIFSLNLIADNNLLVGGAAGGASYTADGGATYVALGGLFNLGGTNVVLTADKLTTGGNIYAAATGAGAVVSRYTIGTSFLWTGGQATPGAGAMGIALSNGVLYVLDDAGTNLYRFLMPSIFIATGFGSTVAEAGAYTQGVNKLQASAAGTTGTVWAINAAAIDTLDNFNDYLGVAANAPTVIYPKAGDKIDINSISGAVAAFVFKWNAPTVVTVPATSYRYNVNVFLDELGTILVANVVNTPAAPTPAPSVSCASGVVGFVGVPGETYYWNVSVSVVTNTIAAAQAMTSYPSAMATFTVQQLTAIVPTLSSPQNGNVVAAGMAPAFSWSPISGAASYKFELDTGTTFTAPLYSTTSTSAGVSLPATVKLVPGKNYFWRVKALTPTEGEWSTVGNFSVAEVVTTPPPVTVTNPPAITVNIPTPIVTSVVVTQPAPPPDNVVNPSYIWAIIIIGAVLVIAVIVLIVRTRRSV